MPERSITERGSTSPVGRLALRLMVLAAVVPPTAFAVAALSALASPDPMDTAAVLVSAVFVAPVCLVCSGLLWLLFWGLADPSARLSRWVACPARGGRLHRAAGGATLLAAPAGVYLGARHGLAVHTDVPEALALLAALTLGPALAWALQRLACAWFPAWPSIGARATALYGGVMVTLAFSRALPQVRPAMIPTALAAVTVLWPLAWVVLMGRVRRLSSAVAIRGSATAGVLLCVVAPALPVAMAGTNLAAAGALSVLRTLLDQDGDGYSAQFGGQDCDDDDARVSPSAWEVPGNGIDDNCMGGDLASLRPPPLSSPRLTDKAQPLDVVLISLDAWRADGFTPELMPNLAHYARQARRYTRAYASAPYTRMSLLSVFTGWLPSDFDFQGNLVGLDTTLAEVLGQLGYQGQAIHSVPQLSPLATLGFQSVVARQVEGYYSTQAKPLTQAALDSLQREASSPRLTWLHILDPHGYYVPHPGFEHLGMNRIGRYRQELAATDAALKPLLRHLSRPEVAARTVVAIFADHGEYMLERGLTAHPNFLYEPVVHVPLILKAPGLEPAVVPEPVGLVDLFPTLMELVGVTGVAERSGRSLLRPAEDRALTMEARSPVEPLPRSLAQLQDGWLLHCGDGTAPCELFNVGEDPGCSDNRILSEPERARRLWQDLGARLDPLRTEARQAERRMRFRERLARQPPGG